jgi:hypothetical protein
MRQYSLPDSATALDIRAAFALAKVYRRFDLWPHEQMIGEALTAAERYPITAQLVEDQMTVCPLLFADEPELVIAWNFGVQEQRDFLAGLDEIMREAAYEDAEAAAEAAYLEDLKTKPMPSGAELLAQLLTGVRVDVECHRLSYEKGEGIWITNPYGVDAGLLAPTEKACNGFIAQIRLGVEYGPTPH